MGKNKTVNLGPFASSLLPDREPELPYTAKSGETGAGGQPTPLSARQGVIGIEDAFCFNCGRAIPNPRHGQKFCRRALGQKGSCKDRYWSRGLRRLSELEKEVAYLSDLVNNPKGTPFGFQVRPAKTTGDFNSAIK